MEKLLKLSTVADVLDYDVKTVQKHVREGHLPVVRVGPHKAIRVRESDFDRYKKDETK